MHREREPLGYADLAVLAGDGHVHQLQQRLSSDRLAAGAAQLRDIAQLGHVGQALGLAGEHEVHDPALKLLRGLAAHRVVADRAFETSLPQDGHAVADREGFMELVRDEDDRQALLLEMHEDCLEILDALRRQHGRGLVKDEHLGTLPEGLDDLDLLLLPERQLRHLGVRVDLHAEHVGQPRQALLRLLDAEPYALALTEHEVLEDREVGDQAAVLMHHAYPQVDRVPRARDGDVPAVDADGPFFRDVDACEDVHERRLAGAVLA